MISTETVDRRAANLAVVEDIYGAFGRGDVAAILDHIAEDCRWEEWDAHTAQRAGIPYLQPRTGPAGVADFFGAVAEFDIHDFRVGDRLASDTKVAVEVIIDASTASGGRFRDEELHLWTLDGAGKVVRMRHYIDTAKHIAAAAGQDTTG